MPRHRVARARVSHGLPLVVGRSETFTPDHQASAKDKWVYPSEQMFYNAMKRKGGHIRPAIRLHLPLFDSIYLHSPPFTSIYLYLPPFNSMFLPFLGHIPKEDDMKAVIAIHNVVNERAWKHVLEWEVLNTY